MLLNLQLLPLLILWPVLCRSIYCFAGPSYVAILQFSIKPIFAKQSVLEEPMTTERLQLESVSAKWLWLLVVAILLLALGAIALFAVLAAQIAL